MDLVTKIDGENISRARAEARFGPSERISDTYNHHKDRHKAE